MCVCTCVREGDCLYMRVCAGVGRGAGEGVCARVVCFYTGENG